MHISTPSLVSCARQHRILNDIKQNCGFEQLNSKIHGVVACSALDRALASMSDDDDESFLCAVRHGQVESIRVNLIGANMHAHDTATTVLEAPTAHTASPVNHG